MPPAARITDPHTCPMVDGIVPHVGGPILPACCPTVLIGGLPAARVSDLLTCVGPPDTIVKGSLTVMIGGMPAARLGDQTAHGGVIVFGCPTVIIGDSGGGGGGGAGGGGGGGGGSAGGGGAGAGASSTNQGSSSSDENSSAALGPRNAAGSSTAPANSSNSRAASFDNVMSQAKASCSAFT